MTFQEIRIIATGPCITNQLRDVNTICRRSWYIAAHIWKIYDFKIEVISFIINFSTELTTVVKFEVQVKKWCGRSCICVLFNFQLWKIYINGRNSANLGSLIDKTCEIKGSSFMNLLIFSGLTTHSNKQLRQERTIRPSSTFIQYLWKLSFP